MVKWSIVNENLAFANYGKMRRMRYIKNKKAQFKIQQTAFMLLGVVLFFILVGLFWLSLKSSGIKKSAANLEQEQAIALALSIAESPELSCSGNNAGQCVDFDKAMIIKNLKTFHTLWPISKLEVRRIYPSYADGNVMKECSTDSYSSCNILTIIDDNADNEKASASSFVKLCRKEKNAEGYIYDKCELGEIIVRI